ncbi:MAG: hypothetical protein ACREO9_10580, partial [Lysobacterales bacterium]
LDHVANRFVAQAEPLVRAGADVLIPAGAIPMLLFSQIKGFKVAGAPVLNGLPISLRMAELAADMRDLHGLNKSQRADFVTPPDDILDEFLNHPKL